MVYIMCAWYTVIFYVCLIYGWTVEGIDGSVLRTLIPLSLSVSLSDVLRECFVTVLGTHRKELGSMHNIVILKAG